MSARRCAAVVLSTRPLGIVLDWKKSNYLNKITQQYARNTQTMLLIVLIKEKTSLYITLKMKWIIWEAKSTPIYFPVRPHTLKSQSLCGNGSVGGWLMRYLHVCVRHRQQSEQLSRENVFYIQLQILDNYKSNTHRHTSCCGGVGGDASQIWDAAWPSVRRCKNCKTEKHFRWLQTASEGSCLHSTTRQIPAHGILMHVSAGTLWHWHAI